MQTQPELGCLESGMKILWLAVFEVVLAKTTPQIKKKKKNVFLFCQTHPTKKKKKNPSVTVVAVKFLLVMLCGVSKFVCICHMNQFADRETVLFVHEGKS